MALVKLQSVTVEGWHPLKHLELNHFVALRNNKAVIEYGGKWTEI